MALAKCLLVSIIAEMSPKEVNVLMVSADPNVMVPKSAVSERMAQIGGLVKNVFIIVSANGTSYKLADNVHVFPAGRGLPVLRVGGLKKLAKKVIKENDLSSQNTIVTTQDPFDTGLVGVALKKEFHFPLEIQIHGDIFSPWFKAQSLLHRFRILRAPKVLKFADKVRVVSSAIADSISDLIPKGNIYVLPIAIKRPLDYGERSFLPNKYPGFGFIMLTVARLEPEKNVAQSIRLLKNILTIEPRAGLVILGDGSERKNLEKLAQSLQVRERISFEGWQEDTKNYFASAHLYLQTSVFEGYGMAIAEAALSGRAILSSDVGVAHDLSKLNAAMVVPVNNDEEMFESAKIMLNQEKRTIMGIAAQRVIDSLIVSKEKYLQTQTGEWTNLIK